MSSMDFIEAGETGGSLDAGMKTISYGKSLFVPDYAAAPQSALDNVLKELDLINLSN